MASHRQSFSCPKSTSSRQSVIFFTSQSHFFTWLTLGTTVDKWTNVDEIVYIYLWPVKPWPKKLNWLMFKNNPCLTRFLVQKTMDFPEIWIVSVISWTCERIVIFLGGYLIAIWTRKAYVTGNGLGCSPNPGYGLMQITGSWYWILINFFWVDSCWDKDITDFLSVIQIVKQSQDALVKISVQGLLCPCQCCVLWRVPYLCSFW